MGVRILLFAQCREAAGADCLELDAADGATVSSVLAQLSEIHPALASHIPQCAVAVNQQYAPSSTPIRDGDELALIPPISGGAPIGPRASAAASGRHPWDGHLFLHPAGHGLRHGGTEG